MNQEQFLALRKQHPTFIYEGYDYHIEADALHITYSFTIPNLASFHPTWVMDCRNGMTDDIENLVFSLGLVELVSYWKATCSPTIELPCGHLTDEQKQWWTKLYTKGLGECFYTNGITPPADLFTFHCTGKPLSPSTAPVTGDGVLVPIGGGKDSAVTLELLKGGAPRHCYIINPRKATLDTYRVSGLDSLFVAKRTIDPALIDLNRRGFINGHTPFSALVAFSSVLCAKLHNLPYVALSNESSANEATILGTDVNHQYSKSFEFEADFIQYEKSYIGSGVAYFSLLRPYTELKIAQMFAQNKAYHPIFRSCNVGSKTDIWCGHCPKCLFVYLILSPFLSSDELVTIFGKNLLEDGTLQLEFDKLVGLHPEKPFECVGSRDEVNAAIQATIQQMGNRVLPTLLLHYQANYQGQPYQIRDFLTSRDTENAIPEALT